MNLRERALAWLRRLFGEAADWPVWSTADAESLADEWVAVYREGFETGAKAQRSAIEEATERKARKCTALVRNVLSTHAADIAGMPLVTPPESAT